MIYCISDVHGDKNFKGLQEYLKIATDNDILIVLGDICLQFEKTEENREFTEFFLSIKKKIAFIDGNHENFPYLSGFPKEEWKGGIVRRITENIVYLQRGNVYQIEGKTFFAFGGCKSSKKWAEQGLWFEGETATEEECEIARENLRKSGFSADYILTHKYENDPNFCNVDLRLYELTKWIEEKVSYQKWLFGHDHVARVLDEKHECLYDELKRI